MAHDDECDCLNCQHDARPRMQEWYYPTPTTPIQRMVIDAREQAWLRCGPTCDLTLGEDGRARCRCRA